mmetsp:Transcript_12196/g.26871  ORF Transcript_12196/g.26871 Transcript_12196/m.26871 type:complete len:88 (-) Transcript_12196:415-678(-)
MAVWMAFAGTAGNGSGKGGTWRIPDCVSGAPAVRGCAPENAADRLVGSGGTGEMPPTGERALTGTLASVFGLLACKAGRKLAGYASA